MFIIFNRIWFHNIHLERKNKLFYCMKSLSLYFYASFMRVVWSRGKKFILIICHLKKKIKESFYNDLTARVFQYCNYDKFSVPMSLFCKEKLQFIILTYGKEFNTSFIQLNQVQFFLNKSILIELTKNILSINRKFFLIWERKNNCRL